MKLRRVVLLAVLLVSSVALLADCGTTDPPPGPPPKRICGDTESLTVSVTIGSDSVPVFAWSPDCRAGRLIVMQGFDEYWGTETCGENTYESPIRYGVFPPNYCPEESAKVLTRGLPYDVSVWKFITINPESLQLLGHQRFDF